MNFYRLLSLQTTLINVLQIRQKKFSHISKVHISMYSSTEKATKIIKIVTDIVGTYKTKIPPSSTFKVTIAPNNFFLKQFRRFFFVERSVRVPDEYIGGENLYISDDFDFSALALRLYLKMRAFLSK